LKVQRHVSDLSSDAVGSWSTFEDQKLSAGRARAGRTAAFGRPAYRVWRPFPPLARTHGAPVRQLEVRQRRYKLTLRFPGNLPLFHTDHRTVPPPSTIAFEDRFTCPLNRLHLLSRSAVVSQVSIFRHVRPRLCSFGRRSLLCRILWKYGRPSIDSYGLRTQKRGTIAQPAAIPDRRLRTPPTPFVRLLQALVGTALGIARNAREFD
jgi:hypothetical protein